MTYYNYLGQPMPESVPSNVVVTGNGGNNQTIVAPGGGALIDSGMGQNNVLVGSSGDDTFIVRDATDTVQVSGGLGGTDTIASYGNSYILPANVQNLTVSGTWNYAEGNSGANLITITNDNYMTLYGGGGNDVLVGGFGQYDTFLVPAGGGNDVIYNFNATDNVRLPGTSFGSFAQVVAAMTQVGSDVKLQVDPNDVLIFRNMTIGQFTASNFLLKFDPSVLGATTFDAEFSSPPQFYNFSTKTGQWITNFGYGLNTENSFTLTGNAESEVYVNPSFTGQGTTPLGLNPFSTSNGVLTITASMLTPAQKAAAWAQPIGSGMLSTEGIFEQKYGFFEVNMAVPQVAGAWPAFWMINDGGGQGSQEADIGENRGAAPNMDYVRAFSSNGYAIGNELKTGDTTGFHTYGLLWTPTTLTYYYDGYAVMQAPTPSTWTSPMYMILNLAMGGWGGSWSASQLPAQMQVAWVRAYALADGSSQVVHGAPPALANANAPPPTTGGGSGGSGGTTTPPGPTTGAIQASGGSTELANAGPYVNATVLSTGAVVVAGSQGFATEYDSGTGAQIGGMTGLSTNAPVVTALPGGDWEVTSPGAGVQIYNSSGQQLYNLNQSTGAMSITPTGGSGFVVTDPVWSQFVLINSSGAWVWIPEQVVNGASATPSGVQALSNGGFAVWYQGSSQIDIYGANGAKTAAAHLGAPQSSFAMNTVALPNGDFAAAWLSPPSGGGSAWELQFQTFHGNGQAITVAAGAAADLDPWHTQIELVPTGQPDQAVLLWSQGGAVWGVTATGSTVGTPTPIMAGSLAQLTETPLSNGNIVLTWLQTDNGTQDLWSEVLNPSTLKGTPQLLGAASGDVHVVSTGSGAFAVSWELGSQHEARGYDGKGDYGAVTTVVGDFIGLDSSGRVVAIGPDGHGGSVMEHYVVSLT